MRSCPPAFEGGGNGTFQSYASTFKGDPRISVVQWGNGIPGWYVPSDEIWTRFSDFPIYHDVFFANRDVDQFVLAVLDSQ